MTEFLSIARHHFSALLKNAEGNPEEESRILTLLSEINMRRTR